MTNRTRTTTRAALVLALGGLTIAGLAACSSGSTNAATPVATASASLVGGTTECTQANLEPAAAEAAKALGADNIFTFDDLQCADGWAVVSGLVGNGSTAASEPVGAPTSFVFEAEGQFWVPQDKAKVCGSDPAATTAPADATIPADLYLVGCASG